TQKNTLKDKLISEFESSKNLLFGNTDLREKAMDSFYKQGIPSRKHEEYKYLNIDLVLKGEFSLALNKTLDRKQIEQLEILKDAYVVIIENGVFNEGLSKLQGLPKGLTICSIAKASKDHSSVFEKHYAQNADINADAFIALNTAMAIDGVFVHVQKNTIIETPVHIIHVSIANQKSIINPRNLIIVEQNAQVKIIESYETIDSTAKVFNNALTEIVVEESAIVDHYKIQDENNFGYLLNTTQIIQKGKSVFFTHTFTLSGSLVRNNLNIVLDDEGIEANLNGLYLTNENQIVDNHTLVDHRKPKCNSNELYKGIIDGKSTATFNGKIFVRKDAQKTNAFQSNKNILLSDDGTINTKPQLEIYADDVKCSHGTSTGKLDEDKIFYLRARGLSETSAKKLLMHAFASEVVDTIKIDVLRDYVEEKISKRFE
ncbi:MAG: Fe-S cluster assembly protein SufD, partial [Bacteroidetes bacterium]|nr:Fe-S cluster assembly protein SufD [Bacteroidota bacterium]